MAKDPPMDDVEVELVCPGCGHRMVRTAARLRRDIKVVCRHCGADITGNGDRATEQEPE
jgi:predicted RNA-binding Zn-ribbon protein involved in translation (DUF1610 family)